MDTYNFTFVVGDADPHADDFESRFFEAGCDDATVGSSCGIAKVSFAREAPSLQEAIRSAIADIQQAGAVVDRVQIEHEELAAWSIA